MPWVGVVLASRFSNILGLRCDTIPISEVKNILVFAYREPYNFLFCHEYFIFSEIKSKIIH